MDIRVSNRIEIDNYTPALIKWCRANLVFDNPEYAKKRRMGLWTGSTPSKIVLYEFRGDTLILPYGCLRTVHLMMSNEDTIEPLFAEPPIVKYGGEVPLYDYQARAVDEAFEARYGIIQAPAGSGKTQMGIVLAMRYERRVLWLTHTKDLLQQSRDRAERYMDASLIGAITEGQVYIGKGITFATVQTMSRLNLQLYRDVWDVIICDECHRVCGTPAAVTMFSKVLESLAARHKYGLSATVHRADGMIAATFALLGEVVSVVSREDVAEKIMPVAVYPVFLNTPRSLEYCDTDGTIIYSKMISWLGTNAERNKAIASQLTLNRECHNLVLSDRLDQLRDIQALLPSDLRAVSATIDGKMTSKAAKAERKAALDDMRDGRKRILFATYALAREGLDIPILDRLYLATPQKDAAVIEQSLGRIARACEGKSQPICYDFVDSRYKPLVNAYKRRCAIYRKLGCQMMQS